jgi:hypothetical protein
LLRRQASILPLQHAAIIKSIGAAQKVEAATARVRQQPLEVCEPGPGRPELWRKSCRRGQRKKRLSNPGNLAHFPKRRLHR